MTRILSSLNSLAERIMLPLTAGGLALGIVATFAGQDSLAWLAWTIPAMIVGIWLVASIVADLLRHEAGVDIIAVLAIGGALVLGESLAAAVIAVMLATGAWLERYAAGRAHRELSALVSRAPRIVHRHEGGEIVDHPIADVEVGDRIMVKPGEVVPVDGTVTGVPAVLDESALTGESRLATREAGDPVSSGTVNAGAPFDLMATATAERSTYAGIVRLVEEAQSSKAPFVRLADRYALLFVPLALGMAGLAWLLSGDPVRALSVLVVATPCPLLLAVPIAIVAGISRAARRGIIVKGGGALESLARARVLLFDKTGHADGGASPPRRRDHRARLDPRRGAGHRRIARAGVAARPGVLDRRGRPRARRGARVARGCRRGARVRRLGARRRPHRPGGHAGLRERRGRAARRGPATSAVA